MDEDEFDYEDENDFDDDDDENEDSDDFDDEEDEQEDDNLDDDPMSEDEIDDKLDQLDQEEADLNSKFENGKYDNDEDYEKASEKRMKKQEKIDEKRSKLQEKKEAIKDKKKPNMKKIITEAKAIGCLPIPSPMPCTVCKKHTIFMEPFPKMLVWTAAYSIIAKAQRTPHFYCLNPKCKSYYMRTGDTFVMSKTGSFTAKKNNFFVPRR